MPIPSRLLSLFGEETLYHVICKSISGKKLFFNDENKRYFLFRCQQLLENFVDIYAYSMLENHVHWLVKTKPRAKLIEYLNKLPFTELTSTQKRFLQNACSFHELVEQQFNRLFIAYSLALNKANNTKGHLFSRPFKRILIDDASHLTQLIIYIHANVVKHGLQKDFTEYKWSSYPALISEMATPVKRAEVHEWFGGKEMFIKTHKEMAAFYYQHSKIDE